APAPGRQVVQVVERDACESARHDDSLWSTAMRPGQPEGLPPGDGTAGQLPPCRRWASSYPGPRRVTLLNRPILAIVSSTIAQITLRRIGGNPAIVSVVRG